MKRSIILVFFSLITLNLIAQKEATWWYFGNRCGIAFNGTKNAPVVQTNGVMSSLDGVASISNTKGHLLFYTNGVSVWTKSHATMTNGTGLKGDVNSTQSAIIVQQPVRGNRYWVFTADAEWGDDGLQYSIVDTAASGGAGQVISKNNPLLTKATTNTYSAEKVCAIKHANKVDTWIMGHTGDDNKFYAYKLNALGLSSPVVSSVGPVWNRSGSGARGYGKGYMKFTPDGTKLIALIAGQQDGGNRYFNNAGRIEIYDFDNLTGTVSNPQIIDKSNIKSGVGNISSLYGMELSPNGRYLYVSFYLPSYIVGGSDGGDGLWQLDMLAGNANAIGASCVKVVNSFSTNSGGGMQLALDGKIYLTRGRLGSGSQYLACIEKPNCQGTACSFNLNAVDLGTGRYAQWGIPTFINSFFNKAEFDFGNNAANLCENSLTKLFVTDSTGVDSAVWNFDDPSTGAKNKAKGFTVYHKFTTPKTYSVFVQFYRKVSSAECYADTARKKLTIFANPVVKLGSDTVICDGQEVVKVVSITNATYLWNDGSTVPAYSATKKGWFWLEAKVGGCTGRDSVYVDVIKFPKFSLGNDTLMCQFDSLKLTASDGQKYLWSTGAKDTLASIFVKDSGMVWARAGNAPGCYTYDTVYVKTRSIPKLNLGRDSILCMGDTIFLNAKKGTASVVTNYLWNDASTDTSLRVTTSGIYWARIKDTMCYSSRDTISLTFQSKATFSIGKDTSFCVGGSYLINAALSGAKTWKWQDNASGSTYLAKNAGTYSVTVSNGTCVVKDTIVLDTYSILPFKLGNDTTLCEGATLNPIATPLTDVEYTWMGSVKNYNYPITTSGKYYVDLRDLPKKVCKTTDTIKVTFTKPVKINLGRDTILCVNQTIDLNVAKYAFKSYKWWDNTTSPGIRKNATPPGGIHWVEGDDGVCKSRDSIKVTYRPEMFIPDLGADSVFCDNYSKSIYITEINATSYQWKTPNNVLLATTNGYTVNNPGGTFIGIISDGYCFKRDSVTYSYKMTPAVSLGPDIQVCNGTLPTLDVTASAAETYKWNTGATASTITAPNQPKTKYYVDAFNGNCKGSDSIWVYFSIPPVLTFGFDDSVFCDAPLLNYDFTFYADNTTFKWQDGYSLPTRKIKTPGLYWIVAENKCGKDSASVDIKIDELGCRLYFPEIFSPNGDGVNDVWKPMGQVIEWVELVVYDRWGQIIYKGDPGKGWDGSIKNKDILVPDGVYPVTIAYRQSNAGFPRLYVKNMILTVVK
ncbi:MAG: gliding motility-associated C-terminal domain-containing protein [Bacteroidia bacterium]